MSEATTTYSRPESLGPSARHAGRARLRPTAYAPPNQGSVRTRGDAATVSTDKRQCSLLPALTHTPAMAVREAARAEPTVVSELTAVVPSHTRHLGHARKRRVARQRHEHSMKEQSETRKPRIPGATHRPSRHYGQPAGHGRPSRYDIPVAA